ncbi:hypothetical protein FH972_006088 [Carpinus fangiana]|uniref:AB hydrolase-1 domain-containing protein n=1 Tax=Carpinus fangiana TaxID=176857 RepID=A0A5N6QRJ3_9ROSI|nr:hypothetical protein FH972_006088 [Carpinus fangiana]
MEMWSSNEKLRSIDCSVIQAYIDYDGKPFKILHLHPRSPLWTESNDDDFHGFGAAVLCSPPLVGSGIPKWFIDKSTNSSFGTIQLHLELGRYRWLSRPSWRAGCAVFIVYEFHEPHTTHPRKSRKRKFNEHKGNSNSTTFDGGNPNFPNFVCHFQDNGVDVTKPLVLCAPGVPSVGPNGFWVYIPFRWFWPRYGFVEASITTGSLNVEVKECGARVVCDDSELYQLLKTISPRALDLRKYENPLLGLSAIGPIMMKSNVVASGSIGSANLPASFEKKGKRRKIIHLIGNRKEVFGSVPALFGEMIVLLEGMAGGTTDKQESLGSHQEDQTQTHFPSSTSFSLEMALPLFMNPKDDSKSCSPAMIAPIAVALAVGFLGWAYQALKPPPPKICGSPDGPPITSPRVKLSDGRHLAYRESGVPKEEAKYKIIVVHGFDSSKDLALPVPQELIEELKIYIMFFNRAGYGDSEPYPSHSMKSEAFDIQELADQLQIGSKFYVIGISMGAYPIWSCLKSITICETAFRMMQGVKTGNSSAVNTHLCFWIQEKIKQQGVYESLHQDILACYGKWEFDLLDINNPFPNNEGTAHIWQGYADKIIPFKLNRYISEKLPWIRHHEVTDGGHLMIFKSETCEAILGALLLG